jgi:LysR family transcriptional regulator for metE and metH
MSVALSPVARQHRARSPLFLEVRDLRLVDAVARCGSLTKASRELHLTESALSHQLASLERRVGTKVFARVARRMVITPAGDRLREAARSVLGELLRAEDDLARREEDATSVIRVGAECYSFYRRLFPVLARLRSEFPLARPSILGAPPRHAIERVLEGRLDIAIVTEPLQPHQELTVWPLFAEEVVAVVPPDHPLSARSYADLTDLRDEPLVGSVRATDGVPALRDVIRARGANDGGALPPHLLDVILDLVKGRMGIALLDRGVALPHVRDGSVVAVRLTANGVYRHWNAVTRDPPPAYASAFVRLLAAKRPDTVT